MEKEAAALRRRQEESEKKEGDLLQRLQAMEVMMAGAASGSLGQGNNASPPTHAAAVSAQAITQTQAENPGTDALKENEGPGGC